MNFNTNLAKTIYFEKLAIKIVKKYFKSSDKDITHHTLIQHNYSIDFSIGTTRFDVKYSNPTRPDKLRLTKIWSFDLRDKTDYCDYLVLMGLEQDELREVFLVPTTDLPKGCIKIPLERNAITNSKWRQYRIKKYV